jgi:5-methylcytosine-specific restriction endonuclease McrA
LAKYDEFSSIFGALRRCWARHPRRRSIIEAGIHPTETGPRGGKRISCECCGEFFSQGAIAVDHIDPVVPIGTARRDMTWDEVVDRMFHCPDSNLQRVCKDCHSAKTKEENKKRKELAKNAKRNSV